MTPKEKPATLEERRFADRALNSREHMDFLYEEVQAVSPIDPRFTYAHIIKLYIERVRALECEIDALLGPERVEEMERSFAQRLADIRARKR